MLRNNTNFKIHTSFSIILSFEYLQTRKTKTILSIIYFTQPTNDTAKRKFFNN